jgi:hypothetical protein
VLDPIVTGDAIADFVQENKPIAGTPVTDAQLKILWEGIMTIIYNDLKSNGVILPDSMMAGPYPVTGTGKIE